jgi:hypothetical protein
VACVPYRVQPISQHLGPHMLAHVLLSFAAFGKLKASDDRSVGEVHTLQSGLVRIVFFKKICFFEYFF